MKLLKKTVALALSLLLLAALLPLGQAAVGSFLGQDMPDFTVSTVDGGTFTLSQTLKEKELVIVTFFATWCGPCRMEFPYMRQAYEQYRDRVAIIALSTDPTESMEKLRAYAEDMGLGFPVGSDGQMGLRDRLAVSNIPTTFAVDRFGKIVFATVGAQTSVGAFTRLFDAFVGDGYTETRPLSELPPEKPAIAKADPAALAAALNAGDGVVLSNSDSDVIWPMLPTEKDGVSAVASTNEGVANSASVLLADVTAGEGQALAFSFALSSEAAMDIFSVQVDGKTVKSFSGEYDWTRWCVSLEPGEHRVTFRYRKDSMQDGGQDTLWLGKMNLISSAEAEELLSSLPAYPTADAVSLTAVTEGAREIVFQASAEALFDFADARFWLLPGLEAEVRAEITEDYDPDTAFLYRTYDGAVIPLTQAVSGDAYFITTGVDSLETTGYAASGVYLYRSGEYTDEPDCQIILFGNEEGVQVLADSLSESAGEELAWTFAEEQPPAGQSKYTVRFVDQNGDAVPGCMVNFCTDDFCQVAVADENGMAEFTGEPYAYHVQVVRVPAGYDFDTSREFYAEIGGGEMTMEVTKE